MSTTKQLKVYKGLPTIIKSRARGYYDDKTILTFNTDAESQNITMDVYDGLSYDIVSSASGVKVLNFVNTVLPYKWDYSTALSTNRYCFAPVLENMYYVNFYKYNNFTKIGSPTVDEDTGLVSGFSTSNYIQLIDAFNPGNNPWEVQVKFTTSIDVTTKQKIIGASGTNFILPSFYIENSKFGFQGSSDGSSWLFDLVGSTIIESNTTYWVKIIFTGTEYVLNFSTNGTIFNTDISYASTTPLYYTSASKYNLGVNNISGTVQHVFGGSIDLSETYIKINNSVWWEAKSEYSYNNFSVIGSLNIDYTTSAVSGFSTSNYILPKDNFAITAHSTPWEVKVKFKLTSSQYNPLFGGACGGYMPDLFVSSNNLLSMAVSSNGSSYDIVNNVAGTTPLSLDTVYYAKYGWTGTEYYAEYSTDDVTYTRELTVSSSTGMYSQSSGFYIGFRCGTSLDGVVYLSDTSISFNGVEWWRGATLNRELMPGILSNYTDDGSAVTLNCFANGDTSVVLTPDNNYNGTYLGTVNIQAHTVYNYDPDTGEWTPNV